MSLQWDVISDILGDVREELQRRYASTVKHPEVNSEELILDALETDDWNCIIQSENDFTPYLSRISSSSRDEDEAKYDLVDNYVRCRCAELPMLLQAEALSLQHLERLRRQNMKELILFSQFITFAEPKTDGNDTMRLGESDETLSFEERALHCQQRIRELEQKVIQLGMSKRRHSQRMVLMSAVVFSLVMRVTEWEESSSRLHSRSERRC